MTGQTISHYRVLEKLGEGGMGAVYKAEDEKLGRVVALKFLSGEGAEERERFLREARAAAALNHPNICTVYEVDEEHGFLAMELVEGPSLKQKIAERPLKLEDALGIAVQVCEGLQAAHEKGIVHRDIKPGNILLTPKGQVKITDFGLAAMADRTRITKSGTLLGTPAYMSPEQAKGESSDRRTDIWSLGIVLYEMLAGSPPSAGDNEAAVAHSILYEEPEPITARRSRLPMRLERVIDKALAKETSARYQHVDDLLVDLREFQRKQETAVKAKHWKRRRLRYAGAASLFVLIAVGGWAAWKFGFPGLADSRRPEIRSLAVLPLRNLSGDPEQEFFSDATTEALINSLAQIRSVKVISRTSAMRYKNANKALSEIGSELGVDGVLEGSIQRSNQRVRVSVQLIHASTDANLWARSYDRDLSDVLLLQSEVARAVAEEIKAAITPAELTRLRRAQSGNREAQDTYLRGRYHYLRANERDLVESIRQFERAIQLDSKFAAAWAGLSDAWRQRGVWGAYGFRQVLPKAREAGQKALDWIRSWLRPMVRSRLSRWATTGNGPHRKKTTARRFNWSRTTWTHDGDTHSY